MIIIGSFQNIKLPENTEYWIFRKGANLLLDDDWFLTEDEIEINRKNYERMRARSEKLRKGKNMKIKENLKNIRKSK